METHGETRRLAHNSGKKTKRRNLNHEKRESAQLILVQLSQSNPAIGPGDVLSSTEMIPVVQLSLEASLAPSAAIKASRKAPVVFFGR